MNHKPLFNPKTSQQVESLMKNLPNSVAVIGERGTGKTYASRYIASSVLQSRDMEINSQYSVYDANEIGIEELRAIQSDLTLKVPGKGEIKRVVVIEHFQLLGQPAQNALLKTLEEPPVDTMIILTIDNEREVLTTILSRVQQVRVLPVDLKSAENYFTKCATEEIKKAYVISDGAVGLMSGLLSNNHSHETSVSIEKAKQILSQPKYKRLASIDVLLKETALTPEQLIDGIIRVLKALQVAKMSDESIVTVSAINQKLDNSLAALHDLQNGVSAKLVLTRLFLSV